mgnify:CR=1 FL=1
MVIQKLEKRATLQCERGIHRKAGHSQKRRARRVGKCMHFLQEAGGLLQARVEGPQRCIVQSFRLLVQEGPLQSSVHLQRVEGPQRWKGTVYRIGRKVGMVM